MRNALVPVRLLIRTEKWLEFTKTLYFPDTDDPLSLFTE